MKRSILYLTSILFLLFISFGNAPERVSAIEVDNNISPAYVATQSLKVGFSITSGTATCTCRITPKTSDSITSA